MASRDAPDFVIGLLEKTRVDLHFSDQHRFELCRHVVPGRHLVVAPGQFGILGHHAQLLLPGEAAATSTWAVTTLLAT